MWSSASLSFPIKIDAKLKNTVAAGVILTTMSTMVGMFSRRRLGTSRKSTRGLTVVELLIVIVIIAILAAITMVAYNGVTAHAERTRIAAVLREVRTDLQTRYITDGKWPFEDDTRVKLSAGDTNGAEQVVYDYILDQMKQHGASVGYQSTYIADDVNRSTRPSLDTNNNLNRCFIAIDDRGANYRYVTGDVADAVVEVPPSTESVNNAIISVRGGQ